MGRKPSIDETTGVRLLEAYHRLGSKRAAAEEVGVSVGAAMRFFDDTPRAAAPALATQRQILTTAGASLWDARTALSDTYERVTRLVQQLERGIVLVGAEEGDEEGGRYETLVSPTVLVAAIREAREHVEAAMKFYQLAISIEETRKFQQAVLDAIGEVDEPTRQRILTNLQTRRAMELAL